MPKGKDLLTQRLRERLVALRDHAGMTDSALARAANQRQQDVSRFMLGDMKYPPLDFMDALARVFSYTLPDLLGKDIPPATLTESQRAVFAALKAMKPSQRVAFENLVLKKPPNGNER